MRLTRRQLHKGLAGLALTLATSRTGLAAAGGQASADDVFLNRLSFGATPESRAALAAMGRDAWLEAQLSAPVNGPEITARLQDVKLWIEYEAGETTPAEEGGEVLTWPDVAEHRPLQWLDASPEDLFAIQAENAPTSWAERERPWKEVRVAALVRAVHDPAQLNELMTQFWHDHFNVNGTTDQMVEVLFPAYDRDLRTHALGNFRDLLAVTAKNPVMLRYLNNDESRASPANENYARELLELHTLGQEHYFNDLYEHWRDVPGALDGLASGYIDDDVYEAARALTGWSIGDGRWLQENAYAPTNGRLHYVEAWHDPYQKRILGVEFDANAAPMADGEKLLDLLAAHPGTARFVSGKIMRRLGIEAPSESYRDAVAAVFQAEQDQPDQIARVIRAIVSHPEFDATPAAKLRRPFEYLAATFRATGARIAPRDDDIYWVLSLAGWHQHEVHPPTGHSDHTIDWADTRTITGLINLVLEAHGEWNNASDDVLRRAPEGVSDIEGLAAFWAGRFGTDPAAMAPVFATLELAPDESLPNADIEDEAGWLEWINTMMVVTAALDPAFLYR